MKCGPAKTPHGSCLGRLLVFLTFACLAGLGVAVVTAFFPQDVADLRAEVEEKLPSRDLKEVLRTAYKQHYNLTLREGEINRYLRDTLQARQDGVLKEYVTIRNVMVRLEEGRAEVIIERDIMGFALTNSMYLRVDQVAAMNGSVTTRIFRNGGKYLEALPRPMVGGRFGRLPVPEGFLLLTMSSFEQLAQLYHSAETGVALKQPLKELDFVRDMARIRIEKGKLVLIATEEQALSPAIH